MHRYNVGETQEKNRQKIKWVLVVVSIIVTPLFNVILQAVARWLQNVDGLKSLIGWLDKIGVSVSISFVAVNALLFFLVDRYLWASVLSHFLNIPDVRGTWTGDLRSNYGNGKKVDMTLKIEQTMTRISCNARFKDSSSTSEMAIVDWHNDGEKKLTFTYCNNSRDVNVTQREYHGYNWFLIRDDSMNGWYFTDRTFGDGTTTNGTMELTKLPERNAHSSTEA